MIDQLPEATQTFKDAQGRYFIEGVEVPQAAYNLHEWVKRAEVAEAEVERLRSLLRHEGWTDENLDADRG